MFTLPWSHGAERRAYWRSLLAQHLVGERLDDAGDLGVFQIGAVVLSVQHHPFAVRHHPLDSVEPLAPQLCFAGSADEIDYGERWAACGCASPGRC
jgi:hypothetical protein